VVGGYSTSPVLATLPHMSETVRTSVGKGRWAAGLAALALASCGLPNTLPAREPDFAVRDVSIVVRSDAPFTQATDFPGRVESTVQAALDYWGGTWSDLAGRSITFEQAQNVICGAHQGAFGCFDGDIRLSTRDPAFTFSCVEQTVLVHEVGHAVIGDAGHTDPRWMDFHSLTSRLDGRRGYSASGADSCQLFPSVWQHPPDGPQSSG
jgi:hypothetical protein